MGAKTSMANLIENSSFEVGYGNGWVAAIPNHDGLSKLNLDFSTSVHGKYSLKLPVLGYHPPYYPFLKRFTKIRSEPWAGGYSDPTYDEHWPNVYSRLPCGTMTEETVLEYKYIRIPQVGKKYTLSAWMKADFSEVSATLSFLTGKGSGGSRIVKLDNEWARYFVSYEISKEDIPETKEPSVFLRFEFEGPRKGNVWIDAVQLEEGELTDYQPCAPVEIGMETDYPGNIFPSVAETVLKLSITTSENFRSKSNRVEVSLKIYNYYEKLVHDNIYSICIEKDGTGKILVTVPVKKTGIFRAEAEIIEGDRKISPLSQLIFARIPKLNSTGKRNIDSFFGNHFPLMWGHLKVAESLGFKWTRGHDSLLDFYWWVIEPEKGKYVWVDEKIKAAHDIGIDILVNLERVPWWSSTAPDDIDKWWKIGYYFPSDMKDWEDYVFNVVSHHKGKIVFFEVWNEPHGFPGSRSVSYTHLTLPTNREV